MLQNALKPTYERLRFQTFSGGYTPRPPILGKGTHRGGEVGKAVKKRLGG